MHLDEWQQDVLRGALGEQAGGKWAAFEVGLVVPRQNGKGAVLEALVLYHLFVLGTVTLWSAHEFKTAAEAFRRVLTLVETLAGTTDLKSLGHKVFTSHGHEGIELKGGGRLRFVARSAGSGRGFSADCIVLDEAYNLSSDGMAALLPTLSARPNPQLWYTSSAPLPLPISDVLRRVCRRGRSGEAGALAYYEWCGDPDHADDPEQWARANPALGIRIEPSFVEREREALDDEAFARERLGYWVDADDLRERVMDAEAWAACADPTSKLADPITFAYDVTPNRKAAAIVAAGKGKDGRTHVEVVEAGMPPTRLVQRLAQLVQRHRPIAVVCDPAGPAGSLKLDAEAEGIVVTEATTRDHTQACGAFYDAVADGRLVHLDQPALTAAVDGAAKRTVADAWLWSRANSAVDISPLVAATLAKWAHDHAPPPNPAMNVW